MKENGLFLPFSRRITPHKLQNGLTIFLQIALHWHRKDRGTMYLSCAEDTGNHWAWLLWRLLRQRCIEGSRPSWPGMTHGLPTRHLPLPIYRTFVIIIALDFINDKEYCGCAKCSSRFPPIGEKKTTRSVAEIPGLRNLPRPDRTIGGSSSGDWSLGLFIECKGA